jgi:hypothetical protein
MPTSEFIIKRLMRHVSPEPNSGCWLWTGRVNNKGYAMVHIRSVDPNPIIAHRLMYTLTLGPILEGLTLDHLCRVRCCVNPQHLEPVTHAENVRRGEAGKQQRERTHCTSGHEYTPENTHTYRIGKYLKRFCAKCAAGHGKYKRPH